MRPVFRSLKTWSPPDSRSIHTREGRVEKVKKYQDHQIRVLLINVRITFANQTRTYEIRINCSTLTEVSKLQKEVKRT